MLGLKGKRKEGWRSDASVGVRNRGEDVSEMQETFSDSSFCEVGLVRFNIIYRDGSI